MAGIGRVRLDLRPEAANMDVDEPTVAEVAVAPDPVEQDLTTEDLAGVTGQLDEQPELGLGQVDFLAGERDPSLVGEDLEVAEVGTARPGSSPVRDRRRSARMRADSSLGANGLVM